MAMSLDLSINAFKEEWSLMPAGNITKSVLENINSAELCMAMYDSLDKSKCVFLNGEYIGILPVSGSYSARPGISIDNDKLDLIKICNKIKISNPNREKYTIGSIYLEITSKDGTVARTTLSPQIYAYTNKWDEWGIGIVEHVCGDDEITTELNFNG